MTAAQTLDGPHVGRLMTTRGVDLWGVATNEPRLPLAPPLPTALSFALRLRPAVLDGLDEGPNLAYLSEYRRVNRALVAVGEALVSLLRGHGRQAVRVDDDAPDGPGDPPIFPSKTAASHAGLGWIGKTALLVTPEFGPAVRLGTVFTDLRLPGGAPVTRGRCGRCRACVNACPVGAGRDVTWHAGLSGETLFDRAACETHQLTYPEYDEICGICIWVCPYARRALRRDAPFSSDTPAVEKGAKR